MIYHIIRWSSYLHKASIVFSVMPCSSPRDTVEVASLMESTGRLGVPSLFLFWLLFFLSSFLPSLFCFLFCLLPFESYPNFGSSFPGYILKFRIYCLYSKAFGILFWIFFSSELLEFSLIVKIHEGSPTFWLAHEDPNVRDHRCNPGDGMPARPCEHASCQTGWWYCNVGYVKRKSSKSGRWRRLLLHQVQSI